MLYSEVRDILKTGDVVFYHDKNPFGWLVRWKTKSNWDHVGIVIDFGGRKWLCECAPAKGPHLMLLSDRIPHMAMVRADNLLLNEDAINYAFKQFKLKYNYIDAIRAGLGWRTVYKGMICSEYVGKILQIANKYGISDWGMTPEAIYQAIKINDEGCQEILITLDPVASV